MSQPDRDVARYVLAYLARQGYKNTMSAFLQECPLLPTNTAMMVLPETPLSVVVGEYKARQDSALLIGKLGPRASWDALWEKLEHYLRQLRTLANSLLEQPHNIQPGSTTYLGGRKRPLHARASQRQLPISPDIAVPSVLSNSSSQTQPTTSTSDPNCSASPRKRKKPVQFQPSSSGTELVVPPDPLPAPRQLLDMLLEDESLQHHLADVINSSLVGGPAVADDALDQILALTTAASDVTFQAGQCDPDIQTK